MASRSLSRGIYPISIDNIDPNKRWKWADLRQRTGCICRRTPVSLTRTLFGCPLLTRLSNNINLSESPKYGAFSTYCRFNSCSHFHCISRIICAVHLFRSLVSIRLLFFFTFIYLYINFIRLHGCFTYFVWASSKVRGERTSMATQNIHERKKRKRTVGCMGGYGVGAFLKCRLTGFVSILSSSSLS